MNGQAMSGHPRNGIKHFQHRMALPISAVYRRAFSAAPQVIQRRSVCAGQIADVDIVTYTGAVWSGVVISEYFNSLPQSECRFNSHLDQMCRVERCLARSFKSVGAGDVEIA